MNHLRRASSKVAVPNLSRAGDLTHRARPLTDTGKRLVNVMVHSKRPLALDEACERIGLVDDIGNVMRLRSFGDELKKQIAIRRQLEQAKNLATAIEIRDAPGDGSTRAGALRLKAARMIDHAYAEALRLQAKPAAQVQINNFQQNNAAKPGKPGYVLNLVKPPLPDAKLIEHDHNLDHDRDHPASPMGPNPWAS